MGKIILLIIGSIIILGCLFFLVGYQVGINIATKYDSKPCRVHVSNMFPSSDHNNLRNFLHNLSTQDILSEELR